MIQILSQISADPSVAKDWVDKIVALLNLLEKLIADPRHLIIVSLWCLAYMVKQIDRVPDKDIPLIIVVASALFCIIPYWGDWQAAPRSMVYATIAFFWFKQYERRLAKKLENGNDDEIKPTPETKT